VTRKISVSYRLASTIFVAQRTTTSSGMYRPHSRWPRPTAKPSDQ